MSVHTAEPAAARPALNLVRLRDMGARGEKIAMLTCYDATFARLLDEARDPAAAAVQVRSLMFVARFRQDISRRLDALDAKR